MAPKKSRKVTKKVVRAPLNQPAKDNSVLFSLIALVATFFVGYFVYRTLVVPPAVNEVQYNQEALQQFLNRGSAAPSGSPTATPWPSPSALISGNKSCVLKCIMGGTGAKRCKDRCANPSTTSWSNPTP